VRQARATAYIRGMDKPRSILLYAERDSPRWRYAVDVLLHHILGYSYRLTFDREEARVWVGPLLVYGVDPMAFETGIRVRAVDLLHRKGVQPIDEDPAYWGDLPVFFKTHRIYDVPFDVFAATFYLLSRYEEYLPHSTDAHGRPDPNATLRGREGWLNKALVDRYALRLAALLRQHWPHLPEPCRRYCFVPTIDIDQMYAYRHKPPIRLLLGGMRDLLAGRFRDVHQRLGVVFGAQPDPFDTYSLLHHWHRATGAKPMFFVQMGNYGGHDKAHPPAGRAFRAVVKQLQSEGVVGIHPSYRSNEQAKLLVLELKRLESHLGDPVRHSRQHFLRMQLPQTLRNLGELGIQHDYTMGYAAETGFRSGTATPHPFYDLSSECVLPITVHPTCVMDVTLMQYLRLTPELALDRIRVLVDEVRAVGGHMITLWHNSSLSGHGPWLGWEDVYPAVLKEAAGGEWGRKGGEWGRNGDA